MLSIAESNQRAVKLPVLQANHAALTVLPVLASYVNQPLPSLIKPGEFVAYFPISGSTDKTFGVVSVKNLAQGTTNSTATTTTGHNLAYAAALVLLFTTYKSSPGAYFAGVSDSQFRLGETWDAGSQLNQVTVNTKDDIWVDCAALPVGREVGALVTLDGVGGGTSGAYTCDLLPSQVSFTYDKIGSGSGGTAVTSTYSIGQLIERAPAGATKVKIRLQSQLITT